MKFQKSFSTGHSFFSIPLTDLIPKDNKKKVLLDRLNWEELLEIGREAYSKDDWKFLPNPRILIGLFVYHCLSDKTYREVEEDFSLHALCQYACGFSDMTSTSIHHTTLLDFEKRLGSENILKIKDIIEKASVKKQPPNSKGRNVGDSFVFESNITYPTDTKLMESVRLFLVDVITTYQKRLSQKHRHYSIVARKEFVSFSKKRKTNKTIVKKAKKSLLQHLRRNIKQAQTVINALEKIASTKREKKMVAKLKTKLQIAKQIYEQQTLLYQGEKIKNRIVNFHRPEIRPIFRGKAKSKTEFGMKVQLHLQGKALILGKYSYDNFYDGSIIPIDIPMMKEKGYTVKEFISDKGYAGKSKFFKQENIVDAVERRGKQKSPPPIPKKRFTRERSRIEGAGGTLKTTLGVMKMRAKTEFGDLVKLCKACIGYNLKYAF